MARPLWFDRDQTPGVFVCVLAVVAFVATVWWARTTEMQRPEDAIQVLLSTYSIGILTCALLLWTYLEWRLHTIRRTMEHVVTIAMDVLDLANSVQPGLAREQQQAVSNVASRLNQHAQTLKIEIEPIHRSVSSGLSIVVIAGAIIVMALMMRGQW